MDSLSDLQIDQDFDYVDFSDPKSPGSPSLSPEKHHEFFENGKKLHRCLIPGCDKIFKFKSEIVRHLLVHMPQRPFKCEAKGCGKSFKRLDTLQNHQRIHNQEQAFECFFRDCGQKFSTKASLNYHMIKHRNQKLFNCNFPGCHKSFATRSQLKQHEKAIKYHQKLSREDSIKEIEEVDTSKKALEVDYFKEKDLDLSSYSPHLKYVVDTHQKSKHFKMLKDAEPSEPFENILNKVISTNIVLEKRVDMFTDLIDNFLKTKPPSQLSINNNIHS